MGRGTRGACVSGAIAGRDPQTAGFLEKWFLAGTGAWSELATFLQERCRNATTGYGVEPALFVGFGPEGGPTLGVPF